MEDLVCSVCGSKHIYHKETDYWHCPNNCFSGGIDITTMEGVRQFLDSEVKKIPQYEALLERGENILRSM